MLKSFWRFLRLSAHGLLAAGLLFGASALHGQSETDRALVKRIRSMYFSSGTRPAYIACDAALDWDSVVAQVKPEQTEAHRRGLELAKEIKTSFVTRGESDTQVTVTADPSLAAQKSMIEKQIPNFLRMYWHMSDPGMLPGSKSVYAVTPNADGYAISRTQENGTSITVQVDGSLLINIILVVGKPTIQEYAPLYAVEGDGQYHVHNLSVVTTFGESKTVIDFDLDYQQVGGFFIPWHVEASMRGAITYKQTFSNCRALDKTNAPLRDPLAAAP